jgi:predicted benzoate:H+ symporter BenE
MTCTFPFFSPNFTSAIMVLPLPLAFLSSTAGFIKGITALRELGEEYVNEKRMLMNFACKSQETT